MHRPPEAAAGSRWTLAGRWAADRRQNQIADARRVGGAEPEPAGGTRRPRRQVSERPLGFTVPGQRRVMSVAFEGLSTESSR